MNPPKNRKPFNWKAFLLSLILVSSFIVVLSLKVIEVRPDYTVTKQKITREELDGFREKVKQMVSRYTVRYENELPIVHPPADSDIYLLSRNYDWGKYILELEQGKPYRLHLATQDMRHAIIIYELRMMNKIKIGEFKTISFTPAKAGRFKILCGEYCGPKHYAMVGNIIVTGEPETGPGSE